MWVFVVLVFVGRVFVVQVFIVQVFVMRAFVMLVGSLALVFIMWVFVAADAVDLFEEIWSDVQKISLKNSWTTVNEY